MKNRFADFFRSIYEYGIRNKEFVKEDGLPYWREKIFNGLLMTLFVSGTVAIVPNIFASIQSDTVLITIADLVVYLSMVFLLLNRTIKLKYKIIAVISLIYLLSLVLLLELGPMGPGFVWLASCSLFAALLIGIWASVFTILLNLFIIGAIALLIYLGSINTVFFTSYTVITWIAVGLNVILFNSLTSIPLAFLLNALEKSHKTEQNLKNELLEYSEQLQVEKEKAMESDRLKSAFLANLSHDIRTPMNAIMGFSELIQNEYTANDKLYLFSDQILQNSIYLNYLINDILDISLIESGQLFINRQKTKLKDIINETKQLISSVTYWNERPNLHLEFVIEPSVLEMELEVDAPHLEQVFINLLTNAIKYTQKGKILFSVTILAKSILFTVEDNGVGIPLKEQDKIFERFSKIKRKNSASYKGIGLGLSITKAITEAMGGKITFVSVENKGTSFMVSLPI